MEINRATIKPSDVGLKDWDIFYQPDLLNDNHTRGLELSNSGVGLGTKVTMGALILVLNSPLQEPNNITLVSKSANSSTTSDINNLIASLDAENAFYDTEIETVIHQSAYVDDREVNEQEIIDAYMKEARSFYPKKRKIVL
jgi:hypothetical protein